MRLFLAILVFIINIQTWTKADDISEFEIEGVSVGNSALSRFSKEEIKNNIKWEYNNDRINNNFVVVEFYNLESAEFYHGIQVVIKPNDKSYKAYAISGSMVYKNNINACYSKMYEVADELTKIFVSANKQEKMKSINKSDKSGKSTYSGIYFYFSDGSNASVQCYDFSDAYSKKNGTVDNLRVAIRSSEYREWYFSSRK